MLTLLFTGTDQFFQDNVQVDEVIAAITEVTWSNLKKPAAVLQPPRKMENLSRLNSLSLNVTGIGFSHTQTQYKRKKESLRQLCQGCYDISGWNKKKGKCDPVFFKEKTFFLFFLNLFENVDKSSLM